MKKLKSDVEQELLDCWTVTNAVDDIYRYIGDDPFFEGMDSAHQDKIMNLLLGVKELYDVKFERTFRSFTELCKTHSNNKD